MLPSKLKRKITVEKTKDKDVSSKQKEKESDYESDEDNLLQEVKEAEADSSDDENARSDAEDNSDDEILSFESYNSEESDDEESLGFEDNSDNFVDTDNNSSDGNNEESDTNEIGSDLEDEDDEDEDADEEPGDASDDDDEVAEETNVIFNKIETSKFGEKKRKDPYHEALRKRKQEIFDALESGANINESIGNPENGFLQKIDKPSTSKETQEDKDVLEETIEEKNKDEYEDGDTSDEEDIRNTVGNIPMHWYDEYKHIGYDWEGKQIMKPPQRDQLDDFLKKMEDPNFWRTVQDPQTGQDVVLSEEDIQLIKKIMKQRNPDQHFDDYAPWVEWFTSEVEKMPIRNIPDSKASFLPSKVEKMKIGRIVHGLKMGWIKTQAEIEREKAANKGPKFYMLWETDTEREKMRRIHDHVAAPKRALPGHAESYNPPPEYLFDEKELKEWENLAEEPHKRKLHFVPQKYKSLRQVPYYDRFIKERFLRCLDLYLCPRAKRTKVTVQPEDLIPKLPSPKDLQPFPTMQNIVYRGHTSLIRSISIEPKGQYLLTGSDDMTVKIWEVSTGRCIKTIHTKDVVRSVAWCPNQKLSLIAVASGKRLLLINPEVGDIKLITKKTDDLLKETPETDLIEAERIKTAVEWDTKIDPDEYKSGVRLVLTHFQEIKQVTWHGRGDYFATVMPSGQNRSVLIHQLSKRRSQIPFSKSKGLVQCVLFHPVKPCLFVATQQHIRIYDLVKQELLKKLMPGCKWISHMAIHPKGDNLLVSTYDKKMMWFDLDLSTKPYQTLKLHASAVRSVAYHLRYPLFASGSDDRGVIVCHGMVYNDLLQNPLIVPLKRLDYHEKNSEFGIFDVIFHPTQPWLFSSGADNTVRLYT